MVRRHTTLLRPLTALTLAMAVVAGVDSRARAFQLPDIPAYPPPPAIGEASPGGSPIKPLAPVDAAARRARPDPIAGRTAPRAGTATERRVPSRPALDAAGAPHDPAAHRTSPDPDPAPDDKDPLGPAKPRPGAPAAAAGAKAEGPVDGYNLPIERIPMGRQTVGLTVEVIAPEVMNVGQTKTIRIIVKNTGVADINTARARYNLPKELDFVSATPKYEQTADDPSTYFFNLNTLAAGSEQVIAVKVKPRQVGTIDHISTVSLMVGARSHTAIQEPKLRVEQTVTPAKVLKGQQVQFRITVSNPGSGPSRNVTVRAKLSSGLRANGDEVVEQTIPVHQAGQHIELEPLLADTIAGGEQTCTVTAESDDVPVASADAKVVRPVTVERPELTMTLGGPQVRYTDTLAEYDVIVANPGSAAAKNVRVSVSLPASGGRLQKPLPAGADWNPATQKLTWVIPNLEPTPRGADPSKVASHVSHVRVLLGGVGSYRVAADAKAGDLFAKGGITTGVSGMADIDFDVDEKKRIIDVGESTIFDIKLKNIGTKDAKKLIVSADLKNVDVTDTAGLDEPTARGHLRRQDRQAHIPRDRVAGTGPRAEPERPRQGGQARHRELPRPAPPRRRQGHRLPPRGGRHGPGHGRHAGEMSLAQSDRFATASISPMTASR